MHFLFIDNIIILCDGTRRNLEKHQLILHLFCKATGMTINEGESTILGEGLIEEVELISNLFPFKWISFDEGLKYLGFRLEPNTCYKILRLDNSKM